MGTFGSSLWGSGGIPAAPAPTGVPVKNLFYMALRLAGVTKFADASAAAPSPDQLGDCLQQGQLLISQAQLKRAMIWTELLTTYVLGTAEVYTLGVGGTLVSTTGTSVRPVKIDRARLILSTTGTPVHLQVFSGSFREFSDLAVQVIPGALPKFLYCDYAYPLASIYLIPQDVGGDSLELYTWSAIPTIATVNDLVAWPPGYDDWFVNNLAVRLASVFKASGASVTDDVRMEARRTAAAIQSRNLKSPRQANDVPQSGRRQGGSFNYYSGTDK
jgi:hypothetical protein